MNCGVYLIKNIINGKEYVGSSRNLKRRERAHWNSLKAGAHRNGYLQNAYNLYGRQSFVFVILEYCLPDVRVEREIWWTDLLDCMSPKGYVLIKGGGKEVSDEARANMSAAHRRPGYVNSGRFVKGHIFSTERNINISAKNKGKVRTEEHRDNYSAYAKNRTPEHQAKINEALRKRWLNSKAHAVGKMLSNEST